MAPVPPLHPETLAWTALLAHWMDFAKAAVALPKDGHGPRWNASVPAIITLQAVTFALAEVGGLPSDERALACDRAEMLINTAANQLECAWNGMAKPASIDEIITDSRLALRRATLHLTIEGLGA